MIILGARYRDLCWQRPGLLKVRWCTTEDSANLHQMTEDMCTVIMMENLIPMEGTRGCPRETPLASAVTWLFTTAESQARRQFPGVAGRCEIIQCPGWWIRTSVRGSFPLFFSNWVFLPAWRIGNVASGPHHLYF